MEKTFVIIKPDAMKKNMAGEILKRYQDVGLKVAAIKIMLPDKELAESHYPKSDSQLLGMGNKTIQSSVESGKRSSLEAHCLQRQE